MSGYYTKLDSGITDSTIWQAPDTTRLVWITMLAMADQNGYVGASMPGLAGRARVSLEACIAAIHTLESPDEWSRTRENEGRRIGPAEGGWVLLNHAKYRAKQSAEDRRERSRLAMQELRANRRKHEPTKGNGERQLTMLAQAEAYTEEREKTPLNGSGVSVFPKGFDEFWRAYPRKVGKDQAAKAFSKRRIDSVMLGRILSALSDQMASDEWPKEMQFIPHPATWLNQGRWQDEAPKHDPNDISGMGGRVAL